MKIIFVKNNMDIGGITSSLNALLKELSTIDNLEITLYLFAKKGEGISEIPNNINIIEGKGIIRLLGVSQIESIQFGVYQYIIRAILSLFTRIFGDKIPYKLLMYASKRINGYDCAVSFTQSAPTKKFHGGCNEFVLNKIDSDSKIAFIHCDLEEYGLDNNYSHSIYSKFKKVALVSKSIHEQFKRIFPKLKHKAFVVKNCINDDKILKLSCDNPLNYDEGLFNIVTVARLGVEKGHIRTLEVFKQLKNEGYNFVWHIVGDGIEFENINENIFKNNLSSNVKLYGSHKNPYRIMKNADLFLLSSYHEAAPIVIDEAMVIGLPILSTKTISHSNYDGVYKSITFCDNTYEGIYTNLKIELEQFKNSNYKKINTKINVDNKTAILQFLDIIDYGK